MYSVQGIFQHHFRYKKVRNILNKIWYIVEHSGFLLKSVKYSKKFICDLGPTNECDSDETLTP